MRILVALSIASAASAFMARPTISIKTAQTQNGCRRKSLAFNRETIFDSASNSKLFMSEEEELPIASKSALAAGSGFNNAGEPSFEIRGFSLGNFVVGLGLVVTALSFGEYFSDSLKEGLSLSGLGFIYGLPILLGGAALKYAEIEPVPCFSTPKGDKIYEQKSTETMEKIKKDVTRHRYGDDAHLDSTVKKLGLILPGKGYPQLRELRQEMTEDGELAFTMVWQSLETPYKMWAEETRVKKYTSFFGPGITAECVKIDADNRIVGIRLVVGPKEEKPAEAEVVDI